STGSRGGGGSKKRSALDLARSGWYNKLVMAIVRPPRCTYSQGDLGQETVVVGSGLSMRRVDFVVQNRRGLRLVCSQWRPSFVEDTSALPCVVYLHGNSSARVDIIKTKLLSVLCTARCTVVAFDFSGSGMSEGEWVTLGYFEQHDVADVLAYLRSNSESIRFASTPSPPMCFVCSLPTNVFHLFTPHLRVSFIPPLALILPRSGICCPSPPPPILSLTMCCSWIVLQLCSATLLKKRFTKSDLAP
ncbi:unnamed protein product, partial [Discosporangium mesarthrocarpum]